MIRSKLLYLASVCPRTCSQLWYQHYHTASQTLASTRVHMTANFYHLTGPYYKNTSYYIHFAHRQCAIVKYTNLGNCYHGTGRRAVNFTSSVFKLTIRLYEKINYTPKPLPDDNFRYSAVQQRFLLDTVTVWNDAPCA